MLEIRQDKFMETNKVLIIAEAGVNHNGSIETAKKLIETAADAGADIVKFQTFKVENLVSRTAKKAAYQQANTGNTAELQYDMLKKLELSEEDHRLLIEHCRKCGIEFWSTAFDTESIQMLAGFGITRWKIPSGEITNLPFLQMIGSFKQEIILSTGMSTMEEIEEALYILTSSGTSIENIIVLHCNTEYPTPMKDVNLLGMLEIRDRCSVKIGYSDHTDGIEVAIAATALGASVIEKHFTLDKAMEGPDHKASLEPAELKAMVKAVRNISLALGDGKKQPSESEIKNKVIARKSIHLKHNMMRGSVISSDDLIMKRPGDGISPMKIKEVEGKKLSADLPAEHKLKPEDLV